MMLTNICLQKDNRNESAALFKSVITGLHYIGQWFLFLWSLHEHVIHFTHVQYKFCIDHF